MSVTLIAHSLINHAGKYLLIKRSAIKRGEPNVYPEYWDIPGGTVEKGELPQEAAVRECQEEVGLCIIVKDILQEDSQLDVQKDQVFTRLVYDVDLLDEEPEVLLDIEEHTAYRWIKGLDEMQGELVVPYLVNILNTL